MTAPGVPEGHAWLEQLSPEECLPLLRAASVGRIAFMLDEYPLVFPVNYRFIESSATPWFVLRTRPGNVIDTAPEHVAFEIDGVDSVSRAGWSVLVRGNLYHGDPPIGGVREYFDSEPWLSADRSSWLFVKPVVITGRRLHPPTTEWVFHMPAYL